MKQFLEYSFKAIPIIIIAFICYVLYYADDKSLTEGMKLSLSALLGGMATFIFGSYSQFIKKIDGRKFQNRKALTSLDIKLNNQLNWLADIEFNLANHEERVKRVLDGAPEIVFDASAYKELVCIEDEIFSINNLRLKNELVSLNTGFKKINNDIKTMASGYRYMVEVVISDSAQMPSYLGSLPHHHENIQRLIGFTRQRVDHTRAAISSCRVLIKDSNSITTKIRNYFILQNDPGNFDGLIQEKRDELESQILETKASSQRDIEDVESRLNK